MLAGATTKRAELDPDDLVARLQARSAATHTPRGCSASGRSRRCGRCSRRGRAGTSSAPC
jgi:hypothetical protein